MNDEERAKYPAHAQVFDLEPQFRAATTFIRYLREKGIVFCEKVREGVALDGTTIYEYHPYYSTPPIWSDFGEVHRDSLFAAFGVDVEAFWREKGEMIEVLRSST